MASIRSKLWRYFLNPLYSKNTRIGSRLNIKLSRLIEAPLPPAFILEKFQVITQQVKGSNIFTVIPKSMESGKIILYLHGGAYIAGITWPHWRFIDKIITETGLKIAVVDYPIAPEHSFEDVYNLLIPWYQDLLKEYLPSRIILMGDSAGGGLALALAQKIQASNLSKPQFMILLSPWLDVTMSNPDISEYSMKDNLLSREALITAGKYYANESDTKNPLISPIYGDLQNLPDIYLFMGSCDILAPDAKLLQKKMRNSNVKFRYYEFDQMFHVWMFYPIPEARLAINKIVKIIVGKS